MLTPDDIYRYSIKGNIAQDIESGVVKSTEIDLTGLNADSRFFYLEHLNNVHVYIKFSGKFSYEEKYSELTNGIYYCDFRECDRLKELREAFSKFDELLIPVPWYIKYPNRIKSVIVDYWIISIIVILATAIGLSLEPTDIYEWLRDKFE